MYLYNKNGDCLEVYHLMPKEKYIKEYKEIQMKKIPEEERVLKAVTNVGPKIQKCSGITFSSEINYGNENAFFQSYHRLISYDKKEKDEALKLLEEYYHYMYNCRTLMVDPNTENTEYYLLSQGNHYTYETAIFRPNKLMLRGMIQIPKSLYLLQQIYFGYGNALDDYDITEQMELFYFKDEPRETYDFDRINSLMAFGLIDNTLNQERLENNSKLVKRLKYYK